MRKRRCIKKSSVLPDRRKIEQSAFISDWFTSVTVLAQCLQYSDIICRRSVLFRSRVLSAFCNLLPSLSPFSQRRSGSYSIPFFHRHSNPTLARKACTPLLVGNRQALRSTSTRDGRKKDAESVTRIFTIC